MSSQNSSQLDSQLSEEETVSVDSYLDKRVYTTEGKYVGVVDEVMLSFVEERVDALGLRDCNIELFKNSRTLGKVGFPYNWVRSVNDVIVVRPIQDETLTV